jgi:hypothetical protein
VAFGKVIPSKAARKRKKELKSIYILTNLCFVIYLALGATSTGEEGESAEHFD